MEHYETTSTEMTPGKRVRLEVVASYLHEDSFTYTFCLANGARFSLPKQQRLNDTAMWHGTELP